VACSSPALAGPAASAARPQMPLLSAVAGGMGRRRAAASPVAACCRSAAAAAASSSPHPQPAAAAAVETACGGVHIASASGPAQRSQETTPHQSAAALPVGHGRAPASAPPGGWKAPAAASKRYPPAT